MMKIREPLTWHGPASLPGWVVSCDLHEPLTYCVWCIYLESSGHNNKMLSTTCRQCPIQTDVLLLYYENSSWFNENLSWFHFVGEFGVLFSSFICALRDAAFCGNTFGVLDWKKNGTLSSICII
jgi:hypothetical protein